MKKNIPYTTFLSRIKNDLENSKSLKTNPKTPKYQKTQMGDCGHYIDMGDRGNYRDMGDIGHYRDMGYSEHYRYMGNSEH